jgi:hypothetical protein
VLCCGVLWFAVVCCGVLWRAVVCYGVVVMQYVFTFLAVVSE